MREAVRPNDAQIAETIPRDAVLALVEDMRKKTPMERFIAIKTETDRPYWNLEKMHERLHDKEL